MKRLIQLIITATALVSMGTAHALIVLESEPNNSIATAQNIDGAFGFIPDQVIETNSSFDLGIPNATVFGFSGGGTYDYYSFSVGTGDSPLQTGQPVFFDIDFAQITGLDSNIALYDAAENLLDFNDDSDFDGPGDLLADTLNSFLSYIFIDAGEYYISVGSYDGSDEGGELITSATYQLHVSTVPVPAAVWLFGTGLVALFAVSKRRAARTHHRNLVNA